VRALAHKALLTVGLLVIVISAVTGLFPDLLDYLPLPQPDYTPMPIQELSTGVIPSYGRYNFGSYIVLNSSIIAAGSYVRGNVTLYGVGQHWQQPPRIGILNEDDYIHMHPEDIAKLTENLASFTDVGSCCVDPAYGIGYRIGFEFNSEQTTRYYFLFNTGFTKITIDVLPSERVAPWWRNQLLWAIVGAAPMVIGYLYDRGLV